MSPRLNAEAAAEVMRGAGLEPLVPYPGAQPQWPCRCIACGSETTPRYMNIKNGWGGCKKCRRAAQRVQQRNPEAGAVDSMRAAGLEPLEPYLGRQKLWLCRCLTCGNEVSPKLNSILSGQGGCKWCARRAVDPVAAAQVMSAAGLVPLVPYPGSGVRWRCRCTRCDQEATPSYRSVHAGHAGCLRCSLKATAGASQRLSHEQAAAVMLKRGLEPLEPYANSVDPWRCRCMTCGAEVSPRYGNIRTGWGGCPWCAQKAVDPDEAAAVMRAAGLEPLVSYPGGQTPWACQCQNCHRIVRPRYTGVRHRQRGCRWCASHGFTSLEAASVYLIAHPRFGAAKIGITNAAGNRVAQHLKQGWHLQALVSVSGESAMDIEKAILSWWRKDLGLPPFLGKQEMPQGGWTETVDADAIDVPATIERIRALAAVGLAA